MLKSFAIEDDISIQCRAAVEVRLWFQDGTTRLCYFATPEGLANFGDWIDGTTVRIHYDSPYMIVVSKLDEQTIESALRYIEARGELEKCSLILEDGSKPTA